MIYVTQPVLPNFIEYAWQLRRIWAKKILTNNGPIAEELKNRLEAWLSVKELTLVCNGTCAIDVALEAMDLEPGSEVITTPFSFVATANAIIRKGLKPVFVDVETSGYNISAEKIEKAITPRTSAILAVHVYGIPVQLREIETIAQSNNLRLIYDAAHGFGVRVNEKSLLAYGDIATCSFHATKVFNTGEGGCIVVNDNCTKDISKGINFGFCSENNISEFGINAKMSEFAAALGVANLKSVGNMIKKRAQIYEWYRKYLADHLIPTQIASMHGSHETHWNYAYMPIRISSEKGGETRNIVYEALKKQNIFSRKYFFPIIPETSAYRDSRHKWTVAGSLENAIAASQQTLCLPIYPNISENVVERIANIVNGAVSVLM